MSNYRRATFCGGYYFFTVVTCKRQKILTGKLARKHLRHAFEKVRSKRHFETTAICLLPDHLHLLIDPRESDLSYLMKRLKMKFSGLYRSKNQLTSGRLWQYRFWDHKIRDEIDYTRHLDYIHYNPMKHGLVTSPKYYEHSSFKLYYEKGFYPDDWGVVEKPTFKGKFGE